MSSGAGLVSRWRGEGDWVALGKRVAIRARNAGFHGDEGAAGYRIGVGNGAGAWCWETIGAGVETG